MPARQGEPGETARVGAEGLQAGDTQPGREHDCDIPMTPDMLSFLGAETEHAAEFEAGRGVAYQWEKLADGWKRDEAHEHTSYASPLPLIEAARHRLPVFPTACRKSRR